IRPVTAFLSARDVEAGTVFADGHITVTAMANTHYALVDKAMAPHALSLSYRFAVGGKSIVFTGDTGPAPQLVEFARGADILVSEMATAADRAMVP
ncbi:MBL fold metallo-hydrolase, partial [Streptococcus suis]